MPKAKKTKQQEGSWFKYCVIEKGEENGQEDDRVISSHYTYTEASRKAQKLLKEGKAVYVGTRKLEKEETNDSD